MRGTNDKQNEILFFDALGWNEFFRKPECDRPRFFFFWSVWFSCYCGNIHVLTGTVNSIKYDLHTIHQHLISVLRINELSL